MMMQRLLKIAAVFFAYLWLGGSLVAAEPAWPPVFIDIHGQQIEPFREASARAMVVSLRVTGVPHRQFALSGNQSFMANQLGTRDRSNCGARGS